MGIAKLSKENERFLLSAIEELELDKKTKEQGKKEGISNKEYIVLLKGF